MSFRVESIYGMEILDSRGRPTVQATCRLSSGAWGSASVPSGASTGRAEALELRDGGRRYAGLGCRQAALNLKTEIHPHLTGKRFAGQPAFDRALIELEGTADKSRLGANTLLAASLAFARAQSVQTARPLFSVFAALRRESLLRLPRPMINLFSGGKHAGGQVQIQDLLVLPLCARSLDESLSITFDIYQAAASLTQRKYGMRLLRADEGGLAPPFSSIEQMLEDAVEAVGLAGYRAGEEVALAVDVAASHFYRNGRYRLEGEDFDSGAMVGRLIELADRFPIRSVEDGLHEEDWEAWPVLLRSAGNRLIVGDDLLCTNPARIRRALEARACNALLLKVNQIGTLSEAAEAVGLARSGGWKIIASARSGETEDNWLADLAVGWAADQIKIGSITQSERLSKYNRLLAIENENGFPLAPFE